MCVLVASAQAQTQTAPKQPASAVAASQQDDKLPPARELLDKSYKAMGGMEAYNAITSKSYDASLAMPAGTITMHGATAADSKLALTISLARSERSLGCDGTTGWMNDPLLGGYRILNERETKQAFSQVNLLDLPFQLDKRFTDFKTVGEAELQGREQYVVKMVDENGAPNEALFDKQTGLLTTIRNRQDMGTGPEDIVTTFGDWKTEGAVLMFHRVSVKDDSTEAVMLFSNIKLNEVDPSVFELPQKVVELREMSPAGAQHDHGHGHDHGGHDQGVPPAPKQDQTDHDAADDPR